MTYKELLVENILVELFRFQSFEDSKDSKFYFWIGFNEHIKNKINECTEAAVQRCS